MAICSNCTGNWNGSTCSECKTGWYGSDCSLGAILSNAQITKFTNTISSNAQLTSSKLLFKGKLHGFSASTFHSKCDNKGATTTIVKATTGAIFGGYTSVSWTSPSSPGTFEYASDRTAFLFSLVSSTKVERFVKLVQENGYYYKHGYTNYPYSIYRTSYGPTFGNGADLYIADNANATTSSSILCLL